MSKSSIFFITNRNYQPAYKYQVFGKRFNADGVAALRFGRATFEMGASPKLQKVYVYPEKTGANDFEVAGSSKFLEDLRKTMTSGSSDTLVFIHGFNVDFKEALKIGARILAARKNTDRPLNIVVFTWPSDGTVVPLMSYYSDREDARASGPAVARAFLKLRDFVKDLDAAEYCENSLHLFTHSMGAYVLRHAIQALIAKDPLHIGRLFDQVIVAAPDEDDDAFETDKKLRLLPRIGRHVTVYFNPRDRALLVSDITKANPDRLGSDGPRLIDLIPKKVTLVDCRLVEGDGDKLTNHSYFINSYAMRQDTRQILEGMEPELIVNREYVQSNRSWRIVKELDE